MILFLCFISDKKSILESLSDKLLEKNLEKETNHGNGLLGIFRLYFIFFTLFFSIKKIFFCLNLDKMRSPRDPTSINKSRTIDYPKKIPPHCFISDRSKSSHDTSLNLTQGDYLNKIKSNKK